jgi:hypothetical protein
MKKFICRAKLGWFSCDVLINTDHNDGAWNSSDSNGRLSMVIGVRRDDWPGVVAIVVHEAFEALADIKRCVWEPTCSPVYGSDINLFAMTHAQFTDVAGSVGRFMSEVLPKLAIEFAKFHADKKIKKKKKK